ncbi:MAG TPA: glycosyltransferase [Gemmatimonadales bacterium]|nr:glycosyltransferase [Gemmatimonadales bacterium]
MRVELRVCLVAPSGRKPGGHSVQAANLAGWLRAADRVETVFVGTDVALPGLLRPLDRVPGVRTVVRHTLLAGRLLRTARTCDVIHVFAAAYWSFLLSAGLGVAAGRIVRRPVIVNYHSGEAPDHLARWPRAVRWVLQHAALLVVPSDFLARVFAQYGYTARVIRNGVDPARFRWRARGAPYRRLLCTRDFERNYDVSTALRAFARIRRQRPEARLTLVGGGSEEPRLRRLRDELGLGDAVRFAGRAAPGEIHRYYDEHDVYLNSSIVDNQPLSILEAMAAGLVVVTTAAGGIPDLVEDGRTGRLAPPGSADALAEAAIAVMDDEARFGALARAAREQTAQHDPKRVAGAWVAAYREVAERGA